MILFLSHWKPKNLPRGLIAASCLLVLMTAALPRGVAAQETLPDCATREVIGQVTGRVQLNVPLPGVTDTVRCRSASGTTTTYYLLNAAPGNELSTYLRAFYVYFVWVVGILATVMIMFAGIRWITAAGNSSQIEGAKSTMNGALIGLVLTLTSYVLLQVINPELVRLRVPFVTGIAAKYTGDYCKVIDGVDYQQLAQTAGKNCGDVYEFDNKTTGRSVVCMSRYCADAGKYCLECDGRNNPYVSCPGIGLFCGYYESAVVVTGRVENPNDERVTKVQLWALDPNFGETRGLVGEDVAEDHFVDGSSFRADSGGEKATLGKYFLRLEKPLRADCESPTFTFTPQAGLPAQRSFTINADDCTLTAS
jgi:hypothetical protein